MQSLQSTSYVNVLLAGAQILIYSDAYCMTVVLLTQRYKRQLKERGYLNSISKMKRSTERFLFVSVRRIRKKKASASDRRTKKKKHGFHQETLNINKTNGY